MAEDNVKDGLSHREPVGPVGVDHDRHGPNQVPKKTSIKASRGGKKQVIK